MAGTMRWTYLLCRCLGCMGTMATKAGTTKTYGGSYSLRLTTLWVKISMGQHSQLELV